MFVTFFAPLVGYSFALLGLISVDFSGFCIRNEPMEVRAVTACAVQFVFLVYNLLRVLD